MQGRSILAVFMVLGASVAAASAKQCPLKAPTQHKITFVNLKTIKIDGTAVAFIEDGACPVKIADEDALFEEENKHHQLYQIKLSSSKSCEVEGWDVGPTTMVCKKAGAEDEIERVYVDEGYKAQPCPAGCNAECKAIDPDWNENALKMFGDKWEEKQAGAPAKKAKTETATATKSKSSAAVKSGASTGTKSGASAEVSAGASAEASAGASAVTKSGALKATKSTAVRMLKKRR